MVTIFKPASIAGVLVFSLASCAPTDQPTQNVNTIWPITDQDLSRNQRNEIEGRLRAIGVFNGTVDGTVTDETRKAIKRYQQKLGEAPTGAVSIALLNSLRSAPLAKKVPPKRTVKPKPKLSRPVGGLGGGGGGSWG